MSNASTLASTAEQAVRWTPAQREALGARLREVRQKRGLTAEQAAQYLGYGKGTHAAVTRLERNVLGYVRADHVIQLAELYEVELTTVLPKGIAVDALWQDAVRLNPKLTAPVLGLAQRLRQYREQHQLDEAGLAQRLRDVGPLVLASDVRAWEAGSKEPNPVQLAAIERLVGPMDGAARAEDSQMPPGLRASPPTNQRRWVFSTRKSA